MFSMDIDMLRIVQSHYNSNPSLVGAKLCKWDMRVLIHASYGPTPYSNLGSISKSTVV